MTTTTEHDLAAATARVDDIHAHQYERDCGDATDWPDYIPEIETGGWYLMLSYFGRGWAATFDITLDTEWYEDDRIELLHTGVRAPTAAAAINGACDKVDALIAKARQQARRGRG
jgi:hypothetical protein